MTATEHFQRLHMIERHAHTEAVAARLNIEAMAETHSNFSMVLDALLSKADELDWASDDWAYSDFIEHLQAASAALDKLYAPKEEQA